MLARGQHPCLIFGQHVLVVFVDIEGQRLADKGSFTVTGLCLGEVVAVAVFQHIMRPVPLQVHLVEF